MKVWQVCVVLTLLSSGAHAIPWTVAPRIALGTEYQDNPRLELHDTQAVGSASLDARAVFSATAETMAFDARPRLRAVRYPGDAELNSDSQGLALNYRYAGERNAWSAASDVSRDSTLATELDDTGFVQARKWRRSWNVNPAWTREWSDTLSGQVSAGYTDVAYEDADATLLVGYTYKNAAAGMSWDSGERTQWGATLTAARLDAPAYRNISDDYGAQVSFAYAWNDTQRLNVSGGARYNDLRLGAGTQRVHEQARGWTMNAAYDAESERNTWHAQASRSVDPSGVGVFVQKDRLVFALMRAFTEEINGSVNLTLLQTEELQNDKISTRRQYARAGVQANWAWVPAWTLSAGYAYAQQHYRGTDDSAGTSSVQFTLTWQDEPKILAQ